MDVREKLVELITTAERKLSRKTVLGNTERRIAIADHLIANGVTVQEWISVKDRLPEVETEVLILARHGNRNVITTGMYEDGQMNTEDSDWWWETEGFEYDEELDVHIIPEGWWEYKHYIDDETHNYAIDGVVTHWMPLPQPPRGE